MNVSAWHSIELFPDGRTLVYVSEDGSKLMRRSLENLESTELVVTDGIGSLFFSPDGEWVGFVAGGEQGELRKVRLDGGPSIPLCRISELLIGASWGDDGVTVFADSALGLMEVTEDGGEPRLIEPVDGPGLTQQQLRPYVLPGSKAVLYAIGDDVAVFERDTGKRTVLTSGSSPKYLAGHLLYEREGSLWAAAFDPARLQIRGDAAIVLDDIATHVSSAHFTLADNGTLAYVPARDESQSTLVWVDRDGNWQLVDETMGLYEGWARLSPDETRLALEGESERGWDIWIYDLDRRTRTRLSRDERGIDPVWSPQGDSVVFSWIGGRSIYRARADGASEPEAVVTSDEGARLRVTSWSPDASHVTIDALHAGDVWVAALDSGAIEPFVETPGDEWGAKFSPDGRFIAYVSDESGRDEIYVRPYPGRGERWTVSTGGGREPVWSKDGRELFYRNRSGLMSVEVSTEPEFRAGTPRLLFEGSFTPSSSGTYYDVSSDGERFVMHRAPGIDIAWDVVVVLNWTSELERLVSADDD